MNKFFITTAIDYVNAPPHVGHALEKVQADVIARYHRLLGNEVLFLTGTDENSLKNVKAAKKEGIPVQKLVDRNSEKFYKLKEALNLSFNDFIRTTEERHIKGAQKLWSACEKDIYKKKYKGLYCVGCEEFYKESELTNGLCPEHETKPELVEEENYFFKLSKYQDELREMVEKNKLKVVPETRKNEVLSFVNAGLDDICISRSAERAQGWGIDVPGDKSQKIWVWFDALSNYINAVGYATDEKKFRKWWPADLHVIGKGILRFHAVYWPAMLLSAKLPLPKKIFVHGYLTVKGKKMSKSLGNIINPFELVKKYGVDAVRYFLLREIPSTEDGDFTYEKFEERYNSDLANGLGNLINRVVKLKAKEDEAERRIDVLRGRIAKAKFETIRNTNPFLEKRLENFEFNQALRTIWSRIKLEDQTIEKERSWEKELKDALPGLEAGLADIALLLKPFLPRTSKEISLNLFPKI